MEVVHVFVNTNFFLLQTQPQSPVLTSKKLATNRKSPLISRLGTVMIVDIRGGRRLIDSEARVWSRPVPASSGDVTRYEPRCKGPVWCTRGAAPQCNSAHALQLINIGSICLPTPYDPCVAVCVCLSQVFCLRKHALWDHMFRIQAAPISVAQLSLCFSSGILVPLFLKITGLRPFTNSLSEARTARGHLNLHLSMHVLVWSFDDSPQ